MNSNIIHTKISPTGWGFFLILFCTVAEADMSECMNIQSQDKKNHCMASYSGSATFCDKIKNFGDRTQCMRMVIAKQRTAQYGTIRPKEEKKE
jgi:hypothetical protein